MAKSEHVVSIPPATAYSRRGETAQEAYLRHASHAIALMDRAERAFGRDPARAMDLVNQAERVACLARKARFAAGM